MQFIFLSKNPFCLKKNSEFLPNLVFTASDDFSNGWKLILLQNAIHPLQELWQVRLTADQNKVGGKDLTYEECSFQLVYSAAINYDAQFMKRKGHCSAFIHDLTSYNDSIGNKGNSDIDTGVDIALANVANHITYSSCISPKLGVMTLHPRHRTFGNLFLRQTMPLSLVLTRVPP
jgi:hypothetical protein